MTAYRYLAFCKPYGVLSAFTDEEGHNTLKEYIDIPGVYAAGRLDLDSEGLLLLTDDGGLIHRLTDPLHHLPKTYLAQVEGVPTPQAIHKLTQGIDLGDFKTRRCDVLQVDAPQIFERARAITPHGPTTWLRISLTEGKKHQVKRMTAAVGLPTLRLIRIAIGPVALGTLNPGEWRSLTKDEMTALGVRGNPVV
ncbi:MAG TPA: pseudouridine synthase [Longilinea sp.]|nr:pseudouridine synthase [Longilinea sp.]